MSTTEADPYCFKVHSYNFKTKADAENFAQKLSETCREKIAVQYPKLTALFLVFLFSSVAGAADYTGNAFLFGGEKFMSAKDDWEPLDHQREFGVLADARGASWPVSICADVLYSSGKAKENVAGDVLSASVSTSEIHLGLKEIFKISQVSVAVSAGPALLSGSVKIKDAGGATLENNNASALGYFAGIGAYVGFAGYMEAGIVAEYSRADAGDKILGPGTDGDLGGLHVGVMVGGKF